MMGTEELKQVHLEFDFWLLRMVILGKLNDAKVGENHIITGNDYPT
jgi:hypothetical protein